MNIVEAKVSHSVKSYLAKKKLRGPKRAVGDKGLVPIKVAIKLDHKNIKQLAKDNMKLKKAQKKPPVAFGNETYDLKSLNGARNGSNQIATVSNCIDNKLYQDITCLHINIDDDDYVRNELMENGRAEGGKNFENKTVYLDILV